MPVWRVSGYDRESGEFRTAVLAGVNSDHAIDRASAKGIVVGVAEEWLHRMN